MFRYIDHWVGSTSKYQDNLSDKLDTDDLTIKGSFQFHKGMLLFKGLRSFNTVFDPLTNTKGLETISNYSLAITHSPLSNMVITHSNTGDITCEGEYNLWQSDDRVHSVGAYKKTELRNYRDLQTELHILYNYGVNYFFNFGVRHVEYTNSRLGLPSTFSVGAMTRFLNEKDLTAWSGLHLNFNTRSVQEVKALLALENPNVNGILELNLMRKLTPEVQLPSQTISPTKLSYPINLKIGMEAKVTDYFTLFNLITANIEDRVTNELQVGGLYVLDPFTSLRFRVGDDGTATSSLTRRFRNLFDFTFALNCAFKGTTVGEDKKSQYGHVKTKFGLTVSLLDDTLI